MDYFVGGVAALISGNVTPNRPRLIKKALTPVKHPMSPNVTPKSEVIDDKSMFLSPTLQRRKAIIKKSPKRIFENPDMSMDGDELITKSPKADKVKKHLKGDLESNANDSVKEISKHKHFSKVNISPTKSKKLSEKADQIETDVIKKKNSENACHIADSMETLNQNDAQKVSKKKKNKTKSIGNFSEELTTAENCVNDNEEIINPNTKTKRRKKGNNKEKVTLTGTHQNVENIDSVPRKKKEKQVHLGSKIKDSEVFVNPNAISHQDTDSEHESDNEIESDHEKEFKYGTAKSPEESSDDEKPDNKKQKVKLTNKKNEEKPEYQPDADEINRTVFVGNVPFNKKCKKEIKKIFSKHGVIESVRIRAVPVKDAQTSKKLAVIKSELHPSRGTVNVYVKFKEESSVEKALSENNTVLGDCHLRVTRSDTTGAYDSRRALFVGNLPFAIEDETLRAKFEECGEIHSVRIIRDKKTNVGKGFGYVNFASKDGVELALSLSEEDLTIKNRILRVKRCTTGDTRKQKNVSRKEFQKNQPQKKNEKQGDEKSQGAYRRIMHKRKNVEANADGPPNKKLKGVEQPIKNKKQRKEYLGITAEKKKKKNFTKGQRKKKLISELLTK